MINRYFFIVFTVLVCALMTDGKSYYNTVENQFGGLFPDKGMRMAGRYKAIVDDRLIEENATMADAVTTDMIDVISTSYRYQLRFANLNNKLGKTKSIKNPMTGGKTTITSPQWGLVFITAPPMTTSPMSAQCAFPSCNIRTAT